MGAARIGTFLRSVKVRFRIWAMHHADIVLCAVLVLSAGFVLTSRPWGLEKDGASAAGLAGALIGGAALLLVNWISRFNDRLRAKQAREEQIERLEAMIAVELVDVACGLIGAKEIVDAAIVTLQAGGLVPTTFDMTRYRPRPMPFTDSLGPQLLALDERAIDALGTLRSNLSITRSQLDEITAGARFGLLTASALSDGLGHDMVVLAEVFERIAPNRKLKRPSAEPELFTTILARAAKSSTPTTPPA